MPEGWARTDTSDGASFIGKLGGVVVTQSAAAQAPTVETARKDYVPSIEKQALPAGSLTAWTLPISTARGR